jgi:adenylate cyclase
VVAGVAVLAYETDVFQRTELDTVDGRFSIRGETAPPGDIVVVGIDPKTLQSVDRYPLPRSLYGDAIERLDAESAKAIAIDVQFTEQTSARQDNALVRAIGRAGGVVLATTEVAKDGSTNVLGGDKFVHSLGARAAAGNVVLDPGGVVRRVVPSFSGLVTLPVAAVEGATGKTVDSGKFGDHGAWIDYHGPAGTIPEISFSDVLKGNFEPGAFRGKIVVIGATAPSLQDTHPTSTTRADEVMSGPEVQANAIDTVRDGLPLTSTPNVLDALIILGFAFVPLLAGARLSPMRAFLVAVALAAAYLVGVQLAFNGSGLILPVIYPLGALMVSSVATLGLQYVSASVDRERVRGTFARFVPGQVVDLAVERAGEDLRLGAEETECTVLFSDIRGFTTFSENHSPREVVDVLNHYLEEMSSAIFAHGGTITSFIGDGIMAVFGAPIPQDDHAERAVAAAREMLDERLPRFNRWLSERGVSEFRIGIGINSGEVVHGNIGSDQRLDYTAIGDTVNTSARLEGMTKDSGHQIFISETTYGRLRDQQGLVYVDEFEVRGRSAKLKVWAPGNGNTA